MSADSGLKKNLAWNTVGMVMYNFAIWALSAIILRKLGPEAGGIYAVASSIGNTLYAAGLWGMRSFIVSDVEGKYTSGEYFSARVLSVMLSVAVLIPVVMIGGYSGEQNAVLCAYTVFKGAEALIEVIDCFCQKNFHMEINAGSMILRSLLYVTAFAGVLFSGGSLAMAFAGLSVLSLLIFLFFNLRKFRKLEKADIAVRFSGSTAGILKACFPIMVFELLASLIVAVPRLFYERIGDLGDLGIYTSIYTFVIFLQLVINVLIYTLAPYMAKAYHGADMKLFRKYLLLLCGGAAGLGLAAEVMTYLLGRPVISIVYGAAAAPYYTYLYLGIISGVTLAFTWIVSQILVIFSHENLQMVCAVISTAACFVFSKMLVNASDCGRMSLVLILTNIVYITAAFLLLGIRHGKELHS